MFGEEGAGLWRLDQPTVPMLEDYSEGRWQLKFSSSGTKVLIGKPDRGFQVYESADGRLVGPPLGSGAPGDRASLLGFGADEQVLVTGGAGSIARFWRVPNLPARNDVDVSSNAASIWPPSGDAVVATTPDAKTVIIGDQRGDVHVLPAHAGQGLLLVVLLVLLGLQHVGLKYGGRQFPARMERGGRLAEAVYRQYPGRADRRRGILSRRLDAGRAERADGNNNECSYR